MIPRSKCDMMRLKIAGLEAEVSRLQKILCDPVESFGTPELIAWADRLQEILAEWPEEERGDLSFVLIMGSHLKKFVDSWNDPRIAELEEALDRDMETLAIAIYEACRQEAADSRRPIVPESWDERDSRFREQFFSTIRRICSPGYATTPEAEHDSWMRAYEEMGWTYGPVRDAVAKTHPDMVPFDDLPESERQKDAIFLACCSVARAALLGDAPKEEHPIDKANREADEYRRRLQKEFEAANKDCPDCGDRDCGEITCPRWRERLARYLGER